MLKVKRQLRKNYLLSPVLANHKLIKSLANFLGGRKITSQVGPTREVILRFGTRITSWADTITLKHVEVSIIHANINTIPRPQHWWLTITINSNIRPQAPSFVTAILVGSVSSMHIVRYVISEERGGLLTRLGSKDSSHVRREQWDS